MREEEDQAGSEYEGGEEESSSDEEEEQQTARMNAAKPHSGSKEKVNIILCEQKCRLLVQKACMVLGIIAYCLPVLCT